VIEILT